MGHPLRVLVIDDRIPVASLGSGFGRMFDALTVMAADPSLHVAFYGNLDEGVPTLDFPVPGVRRVASLQEHLNTPGVSYEVVIISRPHNAHQYMDYVNTALPGAAVIYDAEALFHRRLESQALFVEDEAERSALMAEAAETKRVEASSVSKADRVVCISRYEADVIEDLTGHPAEVVEPWLLAPNPTPARFREREHIGFVAGWAGGPGGPNSDALLWLAEQVLPRVRAALPNCRLRVTGGDPPSDVAWLAGQGVEFVGAVPDLSEFYNRIRVAVSPTRFGSGVKLKTIEGLQYGVPMVCTSEGAAGLPGRVARTVWITDDPSHFATALISLVSDEAAWRRQREAGLSLATPELITEFGVGRWPAIIHDAAYLKAHSKEDDDREPAELGAQP
jgi:glycosyltransferase involved in cell wall biosynthesis